MGIVLAILVFSLIVFVHEMGHFLLAKANKIRVDEFSIGMGPRIVKWNRKNDETEYGIRLFPIGGFCAMAGEGAEEDKNIPKEKLLQSKTWLQKFLTIVAGVMFNFVFAIIVLFVIGLFNGNPNNKPIVGEVKNASFAYVAGLQTGDLIKEINGVKVNSIDRFMIEYEIAYGKDLNLKVIRDSHELEIKISPQQTNEENIQYGFGFNENKETGFWAAIKYTFIKFISLIEQMYVTLLYLCTGKLSFGNLSGPIGIYNIVGQQAQEGILNLVFLTGYLSINVGVINLLPLPAFDGGRLLFLIIEKIIGKPIDSKVENIIHSIGFVLLIILMLAITSNDIFRFIIKK